MTSSAVAYAEMRAGADERVPLLRTYPHLPHPHTLRAHALRAAASPRVSLALTSVLAAALGALVVALFVLATPHLLPAVQQRRQPPPLAPTFPRPVSMLVLGDWGREAQHGQQAVADALATVVRRERQRDHHVVLFSTGDNFYHSGVTSVSDRQFNVSFESVYHHNETRNLPWYVTLGNHDHLGSIHAQMRYSALSPRWNLPYPYYTRRLSPSLLAIFLDSTPFLGVGYGHVARERNAQSPSEQLVWLQRQLSQLDPHSFFVVVAHHNMYSMSIADHLGTPDVRDAIEPVLRPYRHRMLAYVSGHEHSLMHLQPDAHGGALDGPIDHFISGAGSKLHRIELAPPSEESRWRRCCDVLPLRDTPGEARTVWGRATNGFLVLRFDGARFEAEAVDADARVVYSYSKRMA